MACVLAARELVWRACGTCRKAQGWPGAWGVHVLCQPPAVGPSVVPGTQERIIEPVPKGKSSDWKGQKWSAEAT